MIEQRGLSNHLASLISELGLTARDVIAQTAPQSFVISVWQFLAGPMVGGARPCLRQRDRAGPDPARARDRA